MRSRTSNCPWNRGKSNSKIAGAKQSLLAGQTEDALGVGVGKHGWSMFLLFVECNTWTKNRNVSAMVAWSVAGRLGLPIRPWQCGDAGGYDLDRRDCGRGFD
jgi:hypothetical protein